MKSVVVLLLDACRYDRINKKLSPNIMRIAEEGVFYSNWSATNSCTELSVPIMLSAEDEFIPGNSIMSKLRVQGYKSIILFSNPIIKTRFSRGWDYDIDLFNRGRKPKRWMRRLRKYLPRSLFKFIRYAYRQYQGEEKYFPYIKASGILHSARNIMKVFQGKPYFLWVHLMDPHVPYYPNGAISEYTHRSLINLNDRVMDAIWSKYFPSKEEVEEWIRLYEMEISEMDRSIGRFYNSVDWSDKILIITADHGEEFGEHGGFSHWDNKFIPELLHVPLIKVNGVDTGISKEKHTHLEFSDMIINEVRVT